MFGKQIFPLVLILLPTEYVTDPVNPLNTVA